MRRVREGTKSVPFALELLAALPGNELGRFHMEGKLFKK
jgi:hypothetical protein